MNGQWTLEFSMRITGEDLVGDSVSGKKKIEIPLFADNPIDAEKQARIAIGQLVDAAKREDKKFFARYWSAVGDEDGISFSGFRIFFNFEKELMDARVPAIISGA